MNQTQFTGNLRRDRWGSKAFGCMMTTGKEAHAALPGKMGLWLRYFTRDERLRTGCNRSFEVTLGAAAAPGDPSDDPLHLPDTDQRTPKPVFQMPCQRRLRQWLDPVRPAADKTKVLLTETACCLQAEQAPELGVVAPLGMRVQRQVIGKQIDIVRQQQGQALFHPAGHTAILPAPEQAVVHEDRIGLHVDCSFDQRSARGHAGNDLADLGPPFHLQPVGTVIRETLGLQNGVESLEQYTTPDTQGRGCARGF